MTVVAEGVDVPAQILRSHDVENPIDAGAVGKTVNSLYKICVAVVDGQVCTKIAAGVQLLGCAGRYRYPQAEGLGHLDGVGANAAGAAVNQDGLPR
ncbi:Uncharacterised protein [Mycobacteroides abscessus subsp. abscessus]|nr:Uncharacterised protein [Mycobacteroides abscessus subsp. abscessus]